MKTPYLKKNEVCLLSTNFKPTSNQTKIQKLKRNTLFILLNILKTNKGIEKENRNKKKHTHTHTHTHTKIEKIWKNIIEKKT
jgi:hypothetical protein